MRTASIPKEVYGKVHVASSLDEVRRIESEIHRFSFIGLLLRFSIWCGTTLFNAVLDLLHRLWFSGRTPDDHEIRSIVVYVQGMMGDTAVHLPSICTLRKKFQQATLTVVSFNEQFHLESLLGPLPYIDRVMFIDAQPVLRNGFSFEFSTPALDELRCDLFVNFSPYGNRGVPGFVLREMIFAKKVQARFALGFALNTVGKRGITNAVQHYFVRNEPRRGSEITAALHMPDVTPDEFLPIQKDTRQRIQEKINFALLGGRKIVVMHPGAKFFMKCWSPERFGTIALWLKESMDAIVCVTGLPNEEEISRKVEQSSGGTVINLCGRTSQGELIELLRISSLCVTNDTGTMHLAALLDVPMVTLFHTRLSVTHWFPAASRVRALFSFDGYSYSFTDSDAHDPQLDAVTVKDVQQSIEDVLK